MEDFESSAEDLRAIYPHPGKLCDKLIHTWIEVLTSLARRASRAPPMRSPGDLLLRGQSKLFPRIASAMTIRRFPVLRKPLRARSGLPGRGINSTGCPRTQMSHPENAKRWRSTVEGSSATLYVVNPTGRSVHRPLG